MPAGAPKKTSWVIGSLLWPQQCYSQFFHFAVVNTATKDRFRARWVRVEDLLKDRGLNLSVGPAVRPLLPYYVAVKVAPSDYELLLDLQGAGSFLRRPSRVSVPLHRFRVNDGSLTYFGQININVECRRTYVGSFTEEEAIYISKEVLPASSTGALAFFSFAHRKEYEGFKDRLVRVPPEP